MNNFILSIIILALSTDAFAGVYLNGFLKETTLQNKARAVVYISLVSVVMAALGLLVGLFLDSLLHEFSFGLSLGIVFILGVKMVIKSFKPKFQEMTLELTRSNVLLGFSFALGINAFLFGLAAPAFGVGMERILIGFALVYFLVTTIALILGNKSTRFFIASRMVLAGGFVIAGSAVYFIIKYFEII